MSLLLLVALLYVDDGELLESAHKGKECSERVAKRLQASFNSYVVVIEVTGGGWKPSKCNCWTIGFKWKSGEYSYHHDDKVITEMYLPGIAKAIKKLDPNEAKKGMGVFTDPECSMEDQLK